MKRSRRSFMSMSAVFASAIATSAHAQFGGRQRERGDASMRSPRPGDVNPRAGNTVVLDPVVAVERELPSIRIDLKLTADQAALFDSFERQVRNAAEAGRLRARHLSAFRGDDGSSITADTVIGTIVDDDSQRADAARQALERMKAFYAALNAEQRRQFDRRIIQSLREPLGPS